MTDSTETTLSVERTLELAAPPEGVWRALTDPKELARWFPDRVDQDGFGPGAQGRFFWENHGAYAFRVEAAERPKRLVWCWARDAETPLDEGVTTQIEWVLEPRAHDASPLRVRLRPAGGSGRQLQGLGRGARRAGGASLRLSAGGGRG